MTVRHCDVKITIAATAIAMGLALAMIGPSFASRPVPRTIIGCVINGAFISSDGYHIRPRYKDGREADLHTLEGQRVVLDGSLLPSDVMILKTPPRTLGRCNSAR